MNFREAAIEDINQIQTVRHSVKENTLSNPDLVTDKDCEVFMFERGKGWVCEIDNTIVGFAIADLVESNIWALFVHPDHEKKGIGRNLHDRMLDWYFSKQDNVWLGTYPGTRAEVFYERSGWRKAGMYGKETKFEMTAEEWRSFAIASPISLINANDTSPSPAGKNMPFSNAILPPINGGIASIYKMFLKMVYFSPLALI